MNYDEIDRINTIKEAFQVFDKDNDGFITYDEVVTIIRSMSYHPTEKELNDSIPGSYKKYDFAEMFEIMTKFKKTHSLDYVYLKDKSYLNPNGDGTLFLKDTNYLLTGTGSNEKLSKEDAAEIFYKLQKNGQVNNIEFLKYFKN